jgi:hypothetical protein
MRSEREITPEDVAYQEYIVELINKIKQLNEAGVDTSEQRRVVRSIIEYIKSHDYASADYLIQIIEEDLKRNFSRRIAVETKPAREPASVPEKKPVETCLSYSKTPARPKRSLSHFAGKLVAVSMVFSLLGGSMAWASSGALPGSYLYPVKKSFEQAHLAVAFGPEAKAGLLASFSENRLSEAKRLLAQGETRLVLETLETMAEEIRAGLVQTEKAKNKEKLTARLQANLARHQEALSAVRAKAPEAAQAPEKGLSQAQSSIGKDKETPQAEQSKGKGKSGKPTGGKGSSDRSSGKGKK